MLHSIKEDYLNLSSNDKNNLINIATQLRKSKKLKMFESMRRIKFTNDELPYQTPFLKELSAYTNNKECFLQIKHSLQNPQITATEAESCLYFLRKKLNNKETMPIEDILFSGLTPTILAYVSSKSTIAYEALWCLINLSSCELKSTEFINKFVESNGIDIVINTMRCYKPDICIVEEAIWVLANIIGTDKDIRDAILAQDIHKLIVPILESMDTVPKSFAPVIIDLLRNMLKKSSPKVSYFQGYIPFLCRLLTDTTNNSSINTDVINVFSKMSDTCETIMSNITAPAYNKIVLSLHDTNITEHAIKFIKNISVIENINKAYFNDYPIASELYLIMQSPTTDKLLKKIIFTLANIVLENSKFINQMIHIGLYTMIFHIVQCTENACIIEEFLFLIYNTLSSAKHELIVTLIGLNMMQYIERVFMFKVLPYSLLLLINSLTECLIRCTNLDYHEFKTMLQTNHIAKYVMDIENNEKDSALIKSAENFLKLIQVEDMTVDSI